MAENDAIIKKLSATPDEFRATAERTGCALLKRFSKDSGLEKGVKEGFNYYNFGLLKEDLGDLATQLKKHVCSKVPEPEEAYITYMHSRHQNPRTSTVTSNGMLYASSPQLTQ
jgi:hypothetical protein